MAGVMQARRVRLDSSDQRDWPFCAGEARLTLLCDGRSRATLWKGTDAIQRFANPLAGLAWLGENVGLGGPVARWVGYLSYDLGRLFEELPNTAQDDLRFPLYCFSLHDRGE